MQQFRQHRSSHGYALDASAPVSDRGNLSGAAELAKISSAFIDDGEAQQLVNSGLVYAVNAGKAALNAYIPGLGTLVDYVSTESLEKPLATSVTLYKLGLSAVAKYVPKMYAPAAVAKLKANKDNEIFGDAFKDALAIEYGSSAVGRAALSALGIDKIHSARYAKNVHAAVLSTGAPKWAADAAAATVASYAWHAAAPGYRSSAEDDAWRASLLAGTGQTTFLGAWQAHALAFAKAPPKPPAAAGSSPVVSLLLFGGGAYLLSRMLK